MNLKELQKFNDETLKENTLNTKKPFTRKRIRLDKAMSFSDTLTANNFTQSFRAFWVVEASNKEFKVDMMINPNNSLGDSMPLRPNMNFDFGQMVDGARFEFEAQAGGYIDILFFSIGFGQLGNVELDAGGSFSLSDGSSYNCDKAVVSTTPSLIVPASNERAVTSIKNKGYETIFYGELDKLNDDDWADKCLELEPGETLKWRNKSGLYAKTGAATTLATIFNEVI